MKLDKPRPGDKLTEAETLNLIAIENTIGANCQIWKDSYPDTWTRHAFAEAVYNLRITPAELMARLRAPREWTARGVLYVLTENLNPRAMELLFPNPNPGNWKLRFNRARHCRSKTMAAIRQGIQEAATFTGKPAHLYTENGASGRPFRIMPYGFMATANTKEDAYQAVRIINEKGGIIQRLEMHPPGSPAARFNWSPLVHRMTCNP